MIWQLCRVLFCNRRQSRFSDKATALKIYENGFPVFSLDDNGKPHILGRISDIEVCKDKFCIPADELNRFLRHDDREKTVQEQEEEKPSENTEKQIAFEKICLLTGISVTQLNALPKDIKEEILVRYTDEVGTVTESELAKHINDMLDGKPVNPLKSVEEQIEGNANCIDGIINNLPVDEDGKRSVFATIEVIKKENSNDGRDEREEERERQH